MMISEDGQWQWDGDQWVPNTPEQTSNVRRVAVMVLAGVVVAGLVWLGLTRETTTPAPLAAPPTVPVMLTVEPTTSTTEASRQSRFYAALRDQGLSKLTNPETVGLVETVCESITNNGVNATMLVVAKSAVKNDVDSGELGIVLAVGVPIYCPEHKAAMKVWSNS